MAVSATAPAPVFRKNSRLPKPGLQSSFGPQLQLLMVYFLYFPAERFFGGICMILKTSLWLGSPNWPSSYVSPAWITMLSSTALGIPLATFWLFLNNRFISYTQLT